MKTTLAALTLTALVAGGATVALNAQGGNGPRPEPQRPRLEQRGPQNQGQFRGAGQRGPGFFRQGPGAQQGRSMRRGGPGRPGGPVGPGRGLRGLDLTDAQKEQVKALHEKVRADIEAVLTPEQLEQLKARRGGRGGR